MQKFEDVTNSKKTRPSLKIKKNTRRKFLSRKIERVLGTGKRGRVVVLSHVFFSPVMTSIFPLLLRMRAGFFPSCRKCFACTDI